MADTPFTAGERRGLIALVIIVALTVGFCLGYRGCSSGSPDAETPAADTATAAPPARISRSDSIDAIPRQYRDDYKPPKQHRRSPDGRRRDLFAPIPTTKDHPQ